MATTRITDEDLKFIRDERKDGERQEDTLHRLIHQAKLPAATGGNQPMQVNIEPGVLQAMAEAMRPIISREVKNAIESAMAR